MPNCYLLAVCAGASLDRHSNNVSLFNLVEQVNVRPGAPPPPHGLLPLEVHAYFNLEPADMHFEFEMRFAVVASNGLETFSEPVRHRVSTPRYRTRTIGLPLPPVLGSYSVRVDWRMVGSESWHREPQQWPLNIVEATVKPVVTH